MRGLEEEKHGTPAYRPPGHFSYNDLFLAVNSGKMSLDQFIRAEG